MALTKITGQVVDTTTDLVVGVTTVGGGVSAVDGFFSGIITAVGNASFSGSVSVGGTITYEDVTNVDSVGLITARNGIVVGSGITLSKDGDGFYTGVVTATSFSGSGALLTGVASTENIRTNTNATFLQNVSLGDVTARQKLHISASDSGAANMVFTNTTTGTASADGFIVGITGAEDAQLNMQESANIKFKTADTERLRIEPTGNINITQNVKVAGVVTATSFEGSGANLTGISVGMSTASAQVSGITTVIDLSKDDIRLDVTGSVTIDTKGGTEGNNHVIRIENVGVATVSFSSYFKFPSGGTPNLPTTSGAISLISFTIHRQGRVGVNSIFLAGSSVNFS